MSLNNQNHGAGLYSNIAKEFILQDPTLNLWAGIRDDVLDYFERNHITWWMGDKKNEPTGHLLSSQVACLNHLYFARQRKDVATAILKSVDSSSLKSWILPSKSRKMLSGHKF